MLVILVGKSGAGKSEFIKVSGRTEEWYKSSGPIKDEVRRRGLTVNHKSCQLVADELYGQDVCWQVPFILKRLEERGNLLLDGARTAGEVERLLELCPQSYILAIDALSDVRFERLRQRDGITREQFKQIERDEATKTGLLKLLEMADAVIVNNGSVEALKRKANRFVAFLNHK